MDFYLTTSACPFPDFNSSGCHSISRKSDIVVFYFNFFFARYKAGTKYFSYVRIGYETFSLVSWQELRFAVHVDHRNNRYRMRTRSRIMSPIFFTLALLNPPY